MTEDQNKIINLQRLASAMKAAGQPPELIVDRLLSRDSPAAFKSVLQKVKVAGLQNKAIDDFIALPMQKQPLVTPEEMETKGFLGKAAKFTGVEPLGRWLGAKIAQVSPQQREILSQLEQQGYGTEARTLSTGGVSGRQLAGSALATAGLFAFPFTGRILTGTGVLGAVAKGSKLAKFLTPMELAPTAGIQEFGASIADDKSVRDSLYSAAKSAIIVTATGPVLKRIGKLAGGVVDLISQTFAGTPKKAIDFIIKNPELSKNAINNAIKDESMIFKIADAAQKAIDKIQMSRSVQFGRELSVINEKYAGNRISMTPFVDGAKDVLKQFKVLSPNGKWNLQGIITKSSEINKLKAVLRRLFSQKIRTPEALNDLKRFVLNQQSGGASNEFNAIVKSIAAKTRQTLLKEVPEMGKLLGKYKHTSQLLNVIKKEFGLTAGQAGTEVAQEGGEVVVRENTKRVINAFRRIMKEDKTVGSIVFGELEKLGGKKMMADIIAQYFKSFVPPEGFTRWLGLGTGSIAGFIAAMTGTLGHAATAFPLASFASPRIVGLAARARGRILSGLEKELPRHLGTIGTNIRQAGRQLMGTEF